MRCQRLDQKAHPFWMQVYILKNEMIFIIELDKRRMHSERRLKKLIQQEKNARRMKSKKIRQADKQKEWEKALNYCNVYDAYVMDGGGFNLTFIKYKKYSEQYLRKLERKFWP